MGFARGYLVCLYTVIGVVAFCVIVSSAYVMISDSDVLPFDYGPTSWFAKVPLLFGIVLFLIAIFGCACSKENHPCFLAIYSMLLLAAAVFVLMSGALIVTISKSWMEDILSAPLVSKEVSPGTGGVRQDFADVLLGIGSICCDVEVPSCLEFQPSSGFCYSSADPFESGVNTVKSGDGKKFCNIDEIEEGCADGGLHGFLEAVDALVDDKLYVAGVVLCVLSVIFMIASCSSCFLAVHHPRFKRHKHPVGYADRDRTGHLVYEQNVRNDATLY